MSSMLCVADAATEFDGVHALLHLREVVQLPAGAFVGRMTDLRAADRVAGTAAKRAD